MSDLCVGGVSVEAIHGVPWLTGPSDGVFKLWIEVGGRMSNVCRWAQDGSGLVAYKLDGVMRNMPGVGGGIRRELRIS